jgi:hypothetical protein
LTPLQEYFLRGLSSIGHDEEDLEVNSLTTAYSGEEDAVVSSITDSVLTLTDATGKEHTMLIPDPIKSMNDISITFSTPFKVGDKVVKGSKDLLTCCKKLKKLYRVAFLPILIIFWNTFNKAKKEMISRKLK